MQVKGVFEIGDYFVIIGIILIISSLNKMQRKKNRKK